MSMSTIVALMVAGLGFFFLGLHLVSANLQQTTSRQFRTLIARCTDRFWSASLLGLLAGAVMQSTTAVTVILASMTASRLITVHKALPIIIGTNVGTTLLPFITIFDTHLGVLWVMGLSGIAFSFSRGVRWRIFWGIVLGVGLLFYGINLMKDNAEELRHYLWFQAIIDEAHSSFALALVVGTLLSFLTQSTTAVVFIAVTLVPSGLMGPRETMMIIYGGNLGSTFARMILAGGLKGSARQIGHFQDLFKIAGTALFVMLFYLELYTPLPLVRTLVECLSAHVATQMALVNLVYNLGMAVVFSVFLRPTLRLLNWYWPATAEEDFAKVLYVHAQALDHPETALDLVEKEQTRLIARLPDYLNLLRPNPHNKSQGDCWALHSSFLQLAREVETYCKALVDGPHGVHVSERLINVQSRQSLIEFLEDAVHQLVTTVSQACFSGRLAPLIQSFVEALDFLVLTASEAASSGNAEDAKLLANLCTDRGEMMGNIRKLYLSSEQDLSAPAKALLLSLTSLFERIIWIVRRLAGLLEKCQAYRV
jgi:phosphate:Na+ symporter